MKGQSGVIFEDESRYQFIQVVEEDGVRRLYLDEGLATHSVWREGEVLTGGVWDTYVAVVDLLGRQPERVAMLGNAAGTAARAFERFYPGAKVDGVELDPAVSDAGRRYFGMGAIETLSVHDADARAFLRRTDETYDVIIVDAYRPPYVPFYLATRSSSSSSVRGSGPAESLRSTSRRRPTITTSPTTSAERSQPSCRERSPGSRFASTRS